LTFSLQIAPYALGGTLVALAVLSLAIFLQINKIENELSEILAGERPQRPAVKLALVLPALETKGEKPMPNYELNVGNTAYVPIQTLDAGGKPVPPPAGDVFTLASSDSVNAPVTLGTMPSGPLAGQAAAEVVGVGVVAGATITLTDSAGLTADVQIVDVIPAADPPTTDFLDISDAVVVPTP
jgi:hypothetical protein